MKLTEQIQYHLDAIEELLANSGEYRIRTPDLSRYEYGNDPEALSDKYWEGFNPPQIKTLCGWKLMRRKNDKWCEPGQEPVEKEEK